MSAHTDAEVEAAFRVAPRILKKLREAGATGSLSFTLHDDASGCLTLGAPVTREILALAEDLVMSVRTTEERTGRVTIGFCGGLVGAAGRAGLLP